TRRDRFFVTFVTDKLSGRVGKLLQQFLAQFAVAGAEAETLRLLHDHALADEAVEKAPAATQCGEIHTSAVHLHDVFAHASELSDRNRVGTDLGYRFSVLRRVDGGAGASGAVKEDQADCHQDRKSHDDDVSGSFETS